MMKKELRQSNISLEPEPKDNNYIEKTEITKSNVTARISNNEKFNLLLNSLSNHKEIYDALLSLSIKPVFHKTKNLGKKRQVIVGELLSLFNKSQSNQKSV